MTMGANLTKGEVVVDERDVPAATMTESDLMQIKREVGKLFLIDSERSFTGHNKLAGTVSQDDVTSKGTASTRGSSPEPCAMHPADLTTTSSQQRCCSRWQLHHQHLQQQPQQTLLGALASTFARGDWFKNCRPSSGASQALKSGGIHDESLPPSVFVVHQEQLEDSLCVHEDSFHSDTPQRHRPPLTKTHNATTTAIGKNTKKSSSAPNLTTTAPVKCPPRTGSKRASRSHQDIHTLASCGGAKGDGFSRPPHWEEEDDEHVENLQRIYDMRTWDMYYRITQARQLYQAQHGYSSDHHPTSSERIPHVPPSHDLCYANFFPLDHAAEQDQQHATLLLSCPEEPDHTMIFGDLE